MRGGGRCRPQWGERGHRPGAPGSSAPRGPPEPRDKKAAFPWPRWRRTRGSPSLREVGVGSPGSAGPQRPRCLCAAAPPWGHGARTPALALTAPSPQPRSSTNWTGTPRGRSSWTTCSASCRSEVRPTSRGPGPRRRREGPWVPVAASAAQARLQGPEGRGQGPPSWPRDWSSRGRWCNMRPQTPCAPRGRGPPPGGSPTVLPAGLGLSSATSGAPRALHSPGSGGVLAGKLRPREDTGQPGGSPRPQPGPRAAGGQRDGGSRGTHCGAGWGARPSEQRRPSGGVTTAPTAQGRKLRPGKGTSALSPGGRKGRGGRGPLGATAGAAALSRAPPPRPLQPPL